MVLKGQELSHADLEAVHPGFVVGGLRKAHLLHYFQALVVIVEPESIFADAKEAKRKIIVVLCDFVVVVAVDYLVYVKRLRVAIDCLLSIAESPLKQSYVVESHRQLLMMFW